MRIHYWRVALCQLTAGILALWLMVQPLAAQQTTGTVRGAVTDASGAAVVSAEVELTNSATGISVKQSTNDAGQFVFNLVQPGVYQVRVSQAGFRPVSLTNIPVELNRTAEVDVRLEVGQVTESVEVSAAASQVETAQARVGANIERKLVTDIPISNRNSLAVALLAPGVDLTRNDSQVMDIQGTQAKVNGLRRSANVYYLDGSDNTGTFRNTALQFPNPEAVQEVQISTASTSAEFGKQPGGIFNVITRSGTNEFHGSAFFYFRNSALNANSWSRNLSGSAKPPDNLKQGGGTMGGPIVRNKTFFFASYMRHQDNSPGFQNTRQFPTQAMVDGDFSAFTRPLYDPDTGAPIPGNRISAAKLDPVARKLADLLPRASNFGDRFVYDYTDSTKNNELLAKIDHNLSDTKQVGFSYLRTFGNLDFHGQASNNAPNWSPQVNDSRQDTISARYNWILNPRTILLTKFALANHTADRQNATSGRDMSDFGSKWPLPQKGVKKNLPTLSVSDGFLTHLGYLSLFQQKNFRLGSTLSWIRGTHNVKAGWETQRSAVRQLNDNAYYDFSFDGRSSSTPAGGQPTGNGVFGYAAADFLMGRASSFSVNGLQDYDIYNWSHYFFVQDEWRITPRITLSPGLRYEFYVPSAEKNGRASAFVLGHQSDQYNRAPVNMAFQGDSGVPRGFFNQDRNNFAPRLGLAWDLTGDGKTALRAGAGIYYSFSVMNMPMWNAERTPWYSAATGGETLNLTDPWGTSRTVKYTQPPTPFSDSPNDFNYPPRINALLGYDAGFHTPYTAQWSLSLEREVLSGVVVQGGYAANRGLGFFQILDGNLPQWRDDASLGNVEVRRPIAGYSLVEMINARARSWYDSFQFTTDLRRVKNLTARFTYVYGKALAVEAEDRGQGGDRPANPRNIDGEKGEFGARNTGRLFFVYDVPWLKGANSMAARLAGNWQLSGAFTAVSGSHLNVTLGQDWNFDAQNGDRPDSLGPIGYTSGSRDARMARWFDTSVFARPVIRNTFGNLGRNAVVGPGSWGADFAALKNFPWTETRSFQFRGEIYNLFNHSNLADPNTNMASRDFGRILSRNGNRTMQLGLRFVF